MTDTDRWGLVDGDTAYYHRIVKSGDLLFLSGTAFDGDGVSLPDAGVELAYESSASANVTAQTWSIYRQYQEGMPEFGSSLETVVQIEQYIPHKTYGDSYVNTSRGPGLLEHDRPTSALMTTGDLVPASCVIAHTGIAIAGSSASRKEVFSSAAYAASITDENYMASLATEPPFNQVATAGPYFFTVGDIVIDWESGKIPENVKVKDFTFWGNEMRNEADYLLDRLEQNLEMVGSTIHDITNVTSYVSTVGDVYELDEAWRRRLGSTPPPARTIIPVRAQGSPRAEAENQTHAEGGIRLEQMTQGVRVSLGARREAIETPFQPLGFESVAVRGGDHIWVSGQFGFDDGVAPISTGTATQARVIVDRLATILEVGGADLDAIGRLRVYLTDPGEASAVIAVLRESFASPPAMIVSGVRNPLLVPGATVFMDAIALAPTR